MNIAPLPCIQVNIYNISFVQNYIEFHAQFSTSLKKKKQQQTKQIHFHPYQKISVYNHKCQYRYTSFMHMQYIDLKVVLSVLPSIFGLLKLIQCVDCVDVDGI